jgi:diguanylate cyclase (GGDEF)-like protein
MSHKFYGSLFPEMELRDSMIPDQNDSHRFDRFFSACDRLRKNKRETNLVAITFLMLFTASIIFQSKTGTSSNIGGIIAQFQVMISVFVVVVISKRGFIVAVVANLTQSLLVVVLVVFRGYISALPGVLVPYSTIFILFVIFVNDRRLLRIVSETSLQKEKIEALYLDVAAAETEAKLRNEELEKHSIAIKETGEKLTHMAFFDLLTELPNRKMIIDRIELLIRIFAQQGLSFSFVHIDLDNFKRINESSGHEKGDAVLIMVADRLKSFIDADDILGRVGGDEFALLIQRQLKEEDILSFVERLRVELMAPFNLDGTDFIMSGSFGISLFPQDGTSSADILKCADTAMYKAKEYGKNSVQFFRKEMMTDALQKVQLENKMMTAIQNDEFSLYYQPQYSADDKRIRGFEALARWHSPEYGNIRPDQFIPMAEETGYIVRLGEWILRTACIRFKNVQKRLGENYVLSINISAAQIMSPVFIQMVKKAIREIEFDPYSLEFEVTESILMQSMEYVIGVLKELKSIGIRVALDDFGTGYSSLQYLQMLPINTLKIDKSFVETIDLGKEVRPIVGSIISLAHEMNIKVIAEGVENVTQLEYLKRFDCDYIQGYIWGKPLDEDGLYALLQSEQDDISVADAADSHGA